MSDAKNKKSGWYFPPDMAALLGLFYLVLPVAFLTPWLGGRIFTLFWSAKHTGDATLLWISVVLGVAGAALLFIARLPLYRERQFFVIGPRTLDEKHRRIYWRAYLFIGASVLLMVLLLLMLR